MDVWSAHLPVDTQPAEIEEVPEYYELVSAAYDLRNSLDQLIFYLKQVEPIRWQNAPGKVWDVEDATKKLVKSAWKYDGIMV